MSPVWECLLLAGNNKSYRLKPLFSVDFIISSNLLAVYRNEFLSTPIH